MTVLERIEKSHAQGFAQTYEDERLLICVAEAAKVLVGIPVGEHHSVDKNGDVRLYVRVDLLETEYEELFAALRPLLEERDELPEANHF
jgi:hypothetical protein